MRATVAVAEPVSLAMAAAKSVSLTYSSDADPGYQRLRRGRGFYYIDPEGRVVRKPVLLNRFRELVLPPAWRDVWICLSANGHLQATGHDARGRKQYRYHERWRQVRDETKYDRLVDFAAVLPKLRRRIRRDLRTRGMPRERVLATVVALLESTLIRVGNDEYARENRSFGLTTFEDRHAKVRGDVVRFQFRGKSGKVHDVELKHPRVAQMVRQCQALPGRHLFEYRDDAGKVHRVTSSDVNEYLKEVTGQEFTAKDFRTWAGTLLALEILAGAERPRRATAIPKQIVETVRSVAERLGNTPAVCRKSYIHPAVFEAYASGKLPAWKVARRARLGASASLSSAEQQLLRFLKQATRSPSKHARAG
ncbi:MAG: hypothetical protein QM775_24070 [Pirellulales bacterium]